MPDPASRTPAPYVTDLYRSSAAAAPPGRVPPPGRRWSTRIGLPLAILGGATMALAYAARQALMPSVDVVVAPVVARPLGATDDHGTGDDNSVPPNTTSNPSPDVIAQAAGWIEPDPFAVSVSALTSGVVAEVPVLEGDVVERGQVIVRLVDEDARIALARAEAEVKRHESGVEEAKAALEAAQKRWDHPFEQVRAVQTAEALVGEARADVVAAQAAADAARARLAELEDDFARKSPLAERGAVPSGEIALLALRVKAHAAEAAQAEARVPLAQAKLERQEAELVAARTDFELRIDEARALQAARAALNSAQAALESARANRDDAALRLARMEVRAPIDGVVLARLVQPGIAVSPMMDTPTAGQVMRLYDPRQLQVRVDVPLADAGRIGVGTVAEVMTDALPDRVFRGSVTRVVHEADIQRNTVQFKVAIDNPDPTLKPEMLARVRFLSGASGTRAASKTPGAGASGGAFRLYAPEQAVHARDGDTAVFVVDLARNVVRRTPVRTGPRLAGPDEDGLGPWIEVDGVRPGDRVVIDSEAPLDDGDRVRLTRPVSNVPVHLETRG